MILSGISGADSANFIPRITENSFNRIDSVKPYKRDEEPLPAEYIPSDELFAQEFIYNIYCWRRAAEAYLAMGEPQKAAAILQEALVWMPESPYLFGEVGRLLLLAGNPTEGKEFIERSLALQQDNPELQSYLKALRPQTVSFFADADFTFEEINRPELNKKDYPDFPTITLLDQCYTQALPNGSSRKMLRQVRKVLQQDGAEDAARHSIYYIRNKQRVELIHARVIQPNGQIDENAEIRDRDYTSNSNASQMYGSDGVVKYISLPNVTEGSVVDIQYTIEDIGEQLYHNRFCDNYFFGGIEPALLFRYTVIYPEDMPLRYGVGNCAYTPTISKIPGHKKIQWDVKDIPGIKPEPGMPVYPELMPSLALTSFTSWDELGNWAWHLFAPQMELSPEMRQKVKELTTGLSTRREKIAAIYNFVVDEIRYVSISFGRFGYIPHKVERTFRSRYGDCKDTAALFVALLNCADVKARPVLVRTRNRGTDPIGLPSPNSYDHAIAYVPPSKDDPQHFWLDGTTDYFPLGIIPFMDQGTKALVFGQNIAEEIEIDPAKPEDNISTININVNFDTTGSGKIEYRESIAGENSVGLIRALERPEAIKYNIENIIKNRFAGGSLNTFDHSKPDNSAKVWLKLDLSAPHIAMQNGAQLQLMPYLFPLKLSNLTTLAKRRYDLMLGSPTINRTTLTITTDPKLAPATIPGELTLDCPAASFTRITGKKENTLVIKTELTIRKERVSPEEYEEFKKFCDAVSASQQELYTFSVKAGEDAD